MIYEEELDEYGDIKFSDYQFNVGVLIKSTVGKKTEILELPESLGRFVTQVEEHGVSGASVSYPSVNCSDAFDLDIETSWKMIEQVKPYGLCADSNNTVIKGTNLLGVDKKAYFTFEACNQRTDSHNITCMNVTESQNFLTLDDRKIKVELAFQYNFLDFQDSEQAVKSTATIVNLDTTFDGETGLAAVMPLVMGEADIVDELINPITPAENQIRFLNNERISGVDVTTDTIAVDLLLKNEKDNKTWNVFPLSIEMRLSGLT